MIDPVTCAGSPGESWFIVAAKGVKLGMEKAKGMGKAMGRSNR